MAREGCPHCRAKNIIVDMHFAFIDRIQGIWLCPLCGFVTKPIKVRMNGEGGKKDLST